MLIQSGQGRIHRNTKCDTVEFSIFVINLIDCKHLFHCNKLFIGFQSFFPRNNQKFCLFRDNIVVEHLWTYEVSFKKVLANESKHGLAMFDVDKSETDCKILLKLLGYK